MIACFPPVFDKHSKILILGSMPSVKSLESGFYYMHPQNRFWKTLSSLLKSNFVNCTIEQKKKLLLFHHIALWDIFALCERQGSLDSAIKNQIPNDLTAILKTADIQAVFANGNTAFSAVKKHYLTLSVTALPSTSPANVRFDGEKWKEILEYLQRGKL